MLEVEFQNGVSPDEYQKVMDSLNDQEDVFISFDMEELKLILADHEKAQFGRVEFRRNDPEVALSDVPEWLKGSVSECDYVCLFITGDLSLFELYNAVDTFRALLPEKADIACSFRQSDSSDIKSYALVV